MEKSPEAFRTISEVAELLDTPAHVLRFWESRFPQIRPVKRAGGRRYYRPGDVALLSGIKRLLHDDGMTIRGVQKILREHGVRHVAGLSGAEASDPVIEDVEAVLAREFGPESSGPPQEPAVAQTAQIISLERALSRSEAGSTEPAPQAELFPQDAAEAEVPDAPFWAEAEDTPPPAEPALEPALPPAAQAEPEADQDEAEAAPNPGEDLVLAALLRHLPAGALMRRKAELAPLHARLFDLRERLAQASRRRAR